MRYKFTRWLALALVVLASVLGFVGQAHAAWRMEDLPFRMLGRQAIGFSARNTMIGGVDTLFVAAAPARADTSMEFSLLDCENLSTAQYGVTTTDSVACAYIVIQADSNVASTITFKATTVTLQVNYGDSPAGWTPATGAFSALPADNAKSFSVPIFENATFGQAVLVGSRSLVFAPRARVIVTWGASAVAPQSRLFIKKNAGMQQINRAGPSAPSFGPVK